MPQNRIITLAAGDWTQLTDADVSSITFQNRGDCEMFVAATTTADAPSDLDSALKYDPGQGERNATMADLFPGLTGADRLWAFSDLSVAVFVSHA